MIELSNVQLSTDAVSYAPDAEPAAGVGSSSCTTSSRSVTSIGTASASLGWTGAGGADSGGEGKPDALDSVRRRESPGDDSADAEVDDGLRGGRTGGSGR